MEISKFIVCQELANTNYLVYSTRTTALLEIDKANYNSIFVLHDFSNKELVNELIEYGIIVESHAEEVQLLDKIREEFMSLGHQHLTILTTTKCNARCYYCFEKGIHYYDMSKDTADATIKFIIDNFKDPALSILWLGGEPLYNYPIIEYITTRLEQAGYSIAFSVTTNGALLTQDMMDFFKKHSSRVTIQFSLDAAINEEYYRVKRFEGLDESNAFSHVVDNIKLALRNNAYVDVRFNFMTSHIQKAISTFNYVNDLLKDEDMSRAYLFLAPLDLNGDKEIISNFHQEMEHPYIQVVRHQKESGYPIRAELQESKEDTLASYGLMPTCYICGMTTPNKFVVDADGTLYKCHRFVGRKEYSCGTVWRGIDVNSPSYKQFSRTVITDKECLDCSLLPVCQSGCIAKREMLGDAQKCHKAKQVQKELVKMYYDDNK